MSPTGREIFVGRERELRAFSDALRSAKSGQGRIVLLVGEPGIGKSRTSDELAAHARAHGAEVVVARCYEGDGAPAFWPWVQVLRALARSRDASELQRIVGADAALAHLCPELRVVVSDVDEIARAPGGAEDRFRLFDSMTSVLRRMTESMPLMLVIEDLHGADEPSLRLLQFVAREIHGLRLLVLATFRDVALAPEHPLSATLGELIRERQTEQLSLHRFGEEEVASFMELALERQPEPELVAAIHGRTEGNPLFVTEVVRMIASAPPRPSTAVDAFAIPRGIKAAIATRLAELSPASVELLKLAAVFGREFPLDGLVAAAGDGDDTVVLLLEEALATRIIGPSELQGRYRFAHVLIRDVLYEAISPPRRAALHRRVAEALVDVARDDSTIPFAELASHFAAADDLRAIESARRAGDQAAALAAYEEAAKQYRSALAALDRLHAGDEHTRCELLLAIAESEQRAGHIDAAKKLVLVVVESARRRKLPGLTSRAALAYGAEFAWGDGVPPDVTLVHLLEEAIDGWRGEDSALHTRVLGRLATSLYFADEAPRRAALCATAVAMARRLGDAEALWHALDATHTATANPGNGDDRLIIATEMLAIAAALSDERMELRARVWRACDVLELGNREAFDLETAACRRLAGAHREPLLLMYFMFLEICSATMTGAFTEADRFIADLTNLGSRWWSPLLQQLVPLATYTLLLHRGRLAQIVAPLEAFARDQPVLATRSILAQAYAHTGDLVGLRRELAFLAKHRFAVPPDGNTLFFLITSADAAAAIGDTANAAILYAALLPHATRSATIQPGAAYHGSVSHYLGMLALVLERLDEAEQHFEYALAAHSRMGATPWIAHTQYRFAAMLVARNVGSDRSKALDLLGDAGAIAESLGMVEVAHGVRALLEPATAASKDPAIAANGLFRLEGDTWTIAYDGQTIRLRDSRGLRYLVQLLRAPGREFHVTDLVATNGSNGTATVAAEELRMTATLGDAGPRLDRTAQTNYRRRLGDLRDELDDAERANDLGREERVRVEMDALRSELASAARNHRSASHAERARLSVTKGLKSVLDKVADAHPALGAHLTATIHRGYYCSYVPDPRRPMNWAE